MRAVAAAVHGRGNFFRQFLLIGQAAGSTALIDSKISPHAFLGKPLAASPHGETCGDLNTGYGSWFSLGPSFWRRDGARAMSARLDQRWWRGWGHSNPMPASIPELQRGATAWLASARAWRCCG